MADWRQAATELNRIGDDTRKAGLPMVYHNHNNEFKEFDGVLIYETFAAGNERLGQFVRSMSDGGFLGEVALVEGSERTATATCATACELLRFGSFEFGRIMATFPDVRARVEAAVARRPHAATP
jgi:hypothetical protein